MKKILALLLASLLAILALAGCGASGNSQGSATQSGAAAAPAVSDKEMHTVIDGIGNEVSVPVDVDRYIVTAGPYALVAWALEGGNSDRLIGQMVNMVSPMNSSFFEKHDPNYITSCIEAIGPAGTSVNTEVLVSMHPDVVFTWNIETSVAEQLNAAGIPVVMLNVAAATGDEIYDQAKVIADVLGDQEQYEAMRKDYEDRVAFIEEKTKGMDDTNRPGAIYLQTSGLSIAAAGTGYTYQMQTAGGKNLASEVPGEGPTAYWETVDMEQILSWNPDVLILSHFDMFTPDDFYNNKIEGQDWSNINAIKNHKVVKEPSDAAMWCIDYLQAGLYMQWMAKVFQPELFSDLNLVEEVRNYYKTYYNIDMSDEDIAAALQLDANHLTLEDFE